MADYDDDDDDDDQAAFDDAAQDMWIVKHKGAWV